MPTKRNEVPPSCEGHSSSKCLQGVGGRSIASPYQWQSSKASSTSKRSSVIGLPPIRDVSLTSPVPIKRWSRRHSVDDAITVRICNGCISSSAETGISAAGVAVGTQDRSDVDFSAFKRAAEARKVPNGAAGDAAAGVAGLPSIATSSQAPANAECSQ